MGPGSFSGIPKLGRLRRAFPGSSAALLGHSKRELAFQPAGLAFQMHPRGEGGSGNGSATTQDGRRAPADLRCQTVEEFPVPQGGCWECDQLFSGCPHTPVTHPGSCTLPWEHLWEQAALQVGFTWQLGHS